MKLITGFWHFSLIILAIFIGLVFIGSTARGHSHYPTIWGNLYPTSGTYGGLCLICHSNNLELLNAYGRDICLAEGVDAEARIITIEDLDSDNDGISNIEEIETDNQPGWTEGDNPLYHWDTCADALVSVPAPEIIPNPYQPPMDFSIFIPFVIK